MLAWVKFDILKDDFIKFYGEYHVMWQLTVCLCSPSLMFWTNWNEQKPSIMRSTLTGRNVRVIVSVDVITPNGLTIDHKAEKLYFSDGSLGHIERCDYDGSHRYVSMEPLCVWLLKNAWKCISWNGGCAFRALQTAFSLCEAFLFCWGETL